MPSYIVPRQLAQVEYENVCPPPDREILCEDSIAVQLSEQEQAVKRARIEQYATNYLKGKPLHIKSAALRGLLTHSVSSNLTKIIATTLKIEIPDGEGEDKRPMQNAAGPLGSTNRGEVVWRSAQKLSPNLAQIITIFADATGRWHCPVPNCPLAGKDFRWERDLANHVNANHGDSIRINFTYIGSHSNASASQRTGKCQHTPTETTSHATNGAVTARQEWMHNYTIRQHTNTILSGPEDREKLLHALREVGATITSLSTSVPTTSNVYGYDKDC